jgi:prolyl-tRNA synthetase
VRFTDAELIGIPTIVVVGRRIDEGIVEVRDRAGGERRELATAELLSELSGMVRA